MTEGRTMEATHFLKENNCKWRSVWCLHTTLTHSATGITTACVPVCV